MNTFFTLPFTVAALAMPAVGRAQQKPIPVRKVTTLATTDSGAISVVTVIDVMSDGRVFVNDPGAKRRLTLFDASLKSFKVVEEPSKFGSTGGGLLPFPGDSTAFIDWEAKALVVVDARGKFGRAIAPLNTADMRYFVGPRFGVPGFDNSGRLFYRADAGRPPAAPRPPQLGYVQVYPDSAPIIRANFEARKLDTVAMMKIPARRAVYRKDGNLTAPVDLIDPLPVSDEWAHFPDGTVAIVRGHDYHIDWILPNGTRKATPKMPFDWRRLTDDDKRHMVDSLQHALDSAYSADSVRNARARARPSEVDMFNPKREAVKASELPDYYPSVRAFSQMRVDPDGNLWIMPATSSQAKGGTLLDVVNRNGEIVERVQLPPGRVLAGFAPGGIIYMTVPPNYGWARVEKARIERK